MRYSIVVCLLFSALLLTGPGCEPAPKPGPASATDPGQPAPEIDGIDLDGKEFKLSDYRGKVVMLDFWGDWCINCKHFYPHGRIIVKEYAGRPFVLLGVNSDATRDKAKKAATKDDLQWRSWYDGQGGPVASRWIPPRGGWPTVCLIDHRGIIRYVKSPPDQHLDEVLEDLVKKAEKS